MRTIIKGKFPFIRREVTAQEAKKFFADQPYKIELIEGLEKGGTDEYGNKTSEPPMSRASGRYTASTPGC